MTRGSEEEDEKDGEGMGRGAHTTRHRTLGAKRNLYVGASENARFSPEMKEVLKPSVAAIELALLLDKPEDFLARMRRASKPFKYERTDSEREAAKVLRADRSISPAEREDLLKELQRKSRYEQNTQWRADRQVARRWVKLVQMYEENERDKWKKYREQIRKRLAKNFAAGVEAAQKAQILSSNKEMDRWRRRRAADCKRTEKRLRRAYGFKYGKARPLIKADGTVCEESAAKIEWAGLISNGQARLVTTREVNEKRAEMDREEREMAAALKWDAEKFMSKKKGKDDPTIH